MNDPRPSCFNCGKHAVTNISDDGPPSPTDGDVSVCLYCAAISLFTGNGRHTRRPTDEERTDLLADPDVSRAAGGVLLYRLQKGLDS